MASLKLLAIIIAVFCLQLIIPGFENLFILNPAQPNIWMFVSAMFLHANLTHLFLNCFALLVFAPILEKITGKKRFLLLFLLAGIAGNISYFLTVLLGIIPPIPALGASGAIYGILGALAIIYPTLTVFVFYFPMPIRFAAIVWIGLEFFGSFDASSGIGSAAHLGGLLFGIAFGYYFRSKAKITENLEYSDEDEKWEKELK